MRTRWLAPLTLAAAAAFAQDPADTHPPPGVRVTRDAGATLYEASGPGIILDVAILDGEPAQIFLLAAPEGLERHALYRVDLKSTALVALRGDLDPAFDRLSAVDLDGDGKLELLLGRPGRLFTAGPLDGEPPPKLIKLFSAPGVDLAAALDAGSGRLDIPGVGLLRRFGPTDDGWGLLARRALPRRAARHQYGLRLTTPPTTLLTPASGRLLVSGPEVVGERRLRSRLIEADGTAQREVWSRLPEPERLQWSWFKVLDGRPVLIVTTNSADKLGLLERQRLRLFSLYGDRTQEGVGPWLERQTTSRRWQRVEPFIDDIDGDGDEDVVVLQFDGLGSGKIRADALVNNGRRGFEAAERSTVLDRPVTTWSFDGDLTGDGLTDLVVLAEGDLEVYPTVTAGRSRRLVAGKPQWTFPGAEIPREGASVEIGSRGVVVTDDRPESTGRPTLADLDGDGRSEILLAENPKWGFGRLRVVFVPSS